MAKEHILVVEDEEDILELLRYNLAKEGFRVTGVVSGEEGLRAASPPVPQAQRFPHPGDEVGYFWPEVLIMSKTTIL